MVPQQHQKRQGLKDHGPATGTPDNISAEKIAFFGTGAEARAAFERLGQPRLTAVFDNDPDKQGQTIFGCNVAGLEVLDASVDRLVICSMFYAQIAAQLVDFGFPEKKIQISYRRELVPLEDISTHVLAVQKTEMIIADYIEDEMLQVPEFGLDRTGFLAEALKLAPKRGLVMEFGVHEGASLEILCSATERTVYGFDSFRGLKEDWTFGYGAGYFDKAGQTPEVPDNAELIVGYFEDTLEAFLENHGEEVSFMHMDADLYRSHCTVLKALAPLLKPGVVIVFDEYLYANDPNMNDFRAFHDWAKEAGARFKYILRSEHRVALQIL